MEKAVPFPAEVLSPGGPEKDESGPFSIESVLKLQKLIFAGSPLSEVLTHIAQLVESQAEGMFCTIWLPGADGKELHCAAAPSLPGFSARVGTLAVCPKGASCGTAVYRRESVYVTDILTDPIWDDALTDRSNDGAFHDSLRRGGVTVKTPTFSLEVITLPVGDVERALQFYIDQVGFTFDVDYSPNDALRVVQLTPPGSSCSIQIGNGLTDAPVGSLRNVYLVVTDLEAARSRLLERGVEVGEIRHKMPMGAWDGGFARGLDPARGDYASFAHFSDPDGNSWVLQERGYRNGRRSVEAW
jgi:predicted enzyme related to lactoylglutathione lyase